MDVATLTDVLETALDRVPEISTEARKISIDNLEDSFLKEVQEAHIDHELAKIVLPILEVQPEFKDKAPMIKTMNGFVGFQSRFAVPRLVREARRRESAKAAVTWLAKVLGTDSGAGLAIQTLWGIAPTKRISISEGVDLLPLESLPPSCQKEQLINVDWHPAARRVPLPPFAWKPPPAALVAKTEIRPFLIDASTEKNSTDNGISQVQPPLDDIRLCLALEGPSIILAGPRWFQYVDPDLEAAVVTESRSYTHDEILPTIIPDDSVRLTSDVQIIVQKYMKLEPNIRNRTCNALDRLHQSLIRRNPAD